MENIGKIRETLEIEQSPAKPLENPGKCQEMSGNPGKSKSNNHNKKIEGRRRKIKPYTQKPRYSVSGVLTQPEFERMLLSKERPEAPALPSRAPK